MPSLTRKFNPLAALADQRKLWTDLLQALTTKGADAEQVSRLRELHAELERLAEPLVKAVKWSNN